MVTFSRRGLHGTVVDSLGRQIVRGELPPGSIIDTDSLAATMQVSRTVVREALKVLTAKGLVDARPRTGTRVLERSSWNLLDSDVMGWRDDGVPDGALLRDLEEVRQIIEPHGARLAAQRRTAPQLQGIRDAMAAMRRAESPLPGGSSHAHVDADLAFHRAVLAAAGNELLTRLEVVLEPALRARDTLAFGDDHGYAFLDKHQTVTDAIAAGDGEAASEAMLDLLHAAAADTMKSLKRRRK